MFRCLPQVEPEPIGPRTYVSLKAVNGPSPRQRISPHEATASPVLPLARNIRRCATVAAISGIYVHTRGGRRETKSELTKVVNSECQVEVSQVAVFASEATDPPTYIDFSVDLWNILEDTCSFLEASHRSF